MVLARPRDPHHEPVTLEEDDAMEDILEVLGDTTITSAGSLSSSTLQRSLSARVRRRERVGARGCL